MRNWLAILIIVGFSGAQTLIKPSERPYPFTPEESLEKLPERPIVREKYRLGPGDSLLIVVKGNLSYSYYAEVGPGGEIPLEIPTGNPFLITEAGRLPILTTSRFQLDIADKIEVAGKTIKRAEEISKDAFNKYFHGVDVSISLIAPRRFKVFVLGEVRVPGSYVASPFMRVSDIIGKAGGITPLGSKCRIFLKREKDTLLVNMEAFQRTADLSHNPLLESGDLIFVPPMKRYVIVRGGVMGRGEYALVRGDTLRNTTEEFYELRKGERFLDIIERAGGPVPWADLHNSYIERLTEESPPKRVKIPVDLSKLLIDKDLSNNPELEDGDIIVVPLLENTVYVGGDVKDPGPYQYQPGMKLIGYIGLAGGFTYRADIGRTKVIRKTGEVIPARKDPPIKRGDNIFVPDRPIYSWSTYISIAASLALAISHWYDLTHK